MLTTNRVVISNHDKRYFCTRACQPGRGVFDTFFRWVRVRGGVDPDAELGGTVLIMLA